MPSHAEPSLRRLRRTTAARLLQVKSLARARSFDAATAEGASLERYRRATLGAVAGVASRLVSLVTVFISVPLVLHVVGSEEFGIWATLASFAVLLNFADLGISNGLVNMLVRADAEGDRELAAAHVTTALALLTSIAALLGVIFAAVYGSVDWAGLFNVESRAAESVAGAATAVFAGCFLALLPLGLFQRIHLGYQEAFLTYTWGAVGSLISLLGVIGAAVADAGLVWFVAATIGGQVLAAIINGLALLGRSRPWLRPRANQIRKGSLGELASSGTAFFVLQGSMGIVYYAGPLIVAQVAGAAAVEEYAVPMRLFAFLPVLFSMANTAAWPTLRSAVLQGDPAWATRALKRSMWMGFLVLTPPTIVLVLFGDDIVGVWTSHDVRASTGVLLAFAAWSLLSALVWPLWTILVALNAVRVQAVISVLMALGSVLLSIRLAESIGVAGAVLGMTVAQFTFFVIPAALYVPRLLRRSQVA